MRAEFIVPRKVKTELIAQASRIQRHNDSACALGFHGADKTLDDGNGAIFSNGAVAGSDFSAFAPSFEVLTPKLRAFIAYDVFGRLTNGMNSAAEERTDLKGIRLVVEDSEDDYFSGEMIND